MLEIEPVQVCGDEVTACHEVSVLGVNTLCVSQVMWSSSAWCLSESLAVLVLVEY